MSKKIITFDNLIDALDGELAWRRKELFILKKEIPIQSNPLQLAYLRASVTLLYAHWEGYIKSISTFYLNYISYKYLKHCSLKAPFMTLSLIHKLKNYSGTPFENQTKLVQTLLNELNTTSNIPKKNLINTRSNLNFEVFEEICYMIDIDIAPYLSKIDLINDLVNLRNYIAHGEYLNVDYFTFLSFFDDIISIMMQVKTTIENQALQEKFKIASA